MLSSSSFSWQLQETPLLSKTIDPGSPTTIFFNRLVYEPPFFKKEFIIIQSEPAFFNYWLTSRDRDIFFNPPTKFQFTPRPSLLKKHMFCSYHFQQAGTVWVNRHCEFIRNAPFGGIDSSGIGRAGDLGDQAGGMMVEVTLKMSMTESHGDVCIFTWMLTWMVDLSYI